MNTHATFWWNTGGFLAFDHDSVAHWQRVQPDMVVELVDNVYSIHARLQGEHDNPVSLGEVIAWRQRESQAIQSIAMFLGGEHRHFLIGRGRNPTEMAQSTTALAKRLFGPPELLVGYLTIPMTHVFDDEATMREIDAFGENLAGSIIALRPEFVDEYLWIKAAEEALAAGRPTFTWEVSGTSREFSTAEVALLAPLVEGEIVSRDLKLIRQSQVLVGYMPTVPENGKPAISAGQQKEILMAMLEGRHILLCYRSARRPSPFDWRYADVMVASLEDLRQAVPLQLRIIDRAVA